MSSLIKHEIKINLKSIIYYIKNRIFYINLIINLFAVFKCKIHDVNMKKI